MKEKIVELINQLNKLCFEHVNTTGNMHMARQQAVEQVLKQLELCEITEPKEDDK